ncbi:cation transporter [Oculatella sp. LEGE 06141]|uniref:cation diffusion facilitator family transporter n=1 Tax=Oculatella sp. LEGE 06141 TaxID=1828648 RepID=UPI00187F688A|nr:cation diffusion facilitator family transporter [Oculatella sp. LEGE 06141]MBE9180849.1 cation transporter [Oculatella sp. LEGE 06141]
MHHHSTCSHCQIDPERQAQKVRLLWTALVLITAFSLTELGVSVFSHSLALLADSGHMLSDSVALGIALLASWIAQLPPSNQATFGYRRVEILAALANGVGLVAIAIWVAWEAITRLQAPPTEILSLPMLVTAVIGLGVNSLNAVFLHDHSHHDLNLRGAFLHMVADAMSSVGVIIAAIAVWLFHWNWADGAISLVVSGLIGAGAIPLIHHSVKILLEQAPAHLDMAQLKNHLQDFEGVVAVSDLRVWTIALGQEALSAHISVALQEGWARDRLLYQLQTSLQQEFGIQDVFLQMAAPILSQTVNLSQPQTLDRIGLSPIEPSSNAEIR